MRRVAHVALGLVVATALCVVVVVALGPRTGVYRTLTVLSGSMRPTYGPGSMVLVRPTAVDDLEVGDVITYKIPVEDRRVVTHRIVEIVEAGGRPVVRTQGDANNAADPWLARLEGGVAWRVAASAPWLGYGIGALREPLLSRGLVLLCPLLLCLLLVADVWRRPDAESDRGHARVVTSMPHTSIPHTSIAHISMPHTVLARHRSSIDAVLVLASGTDRVVRWTDEVVSGRRWLRKQATRA